MNFTTTCYFPCLCGSCHSVVQVNLIAESTKCPECGAPDPIPYDTPHLSERGGRQVASWHMGAQLGRELVLSDGKYKCPRCKDMSLMFRNSGFWD